MVIKVKPHGSLKRSRSDEDLREQSTSKSKSKRSRRRRTKSFSRGEILSVELENYISLALNSGKEGCIIRSSSTQQPNSKSISSPPLCERTLSAPSGHVRDSERKTLKQSSMTIQKAKALYGDQHKRARDNVELKQAANNLHDFEGVLVLKFHKSGPSHEPWPLPSFFSHQFEAFTSRSLNAGLKKSQMQDMWLFMIKYLVESVTVDFFPEPSLLHSITYHGMRHHKNVKVRQMCQEYLHQLLHGCHPPMNKCFRQRYLDLFHPTPPGNGIVSHDALCSEFSKILEEYSCLSNDDAKPSQDDGLIRLVNFLTSALEIDFHLWQDKWLKSDKTKPESVSTDRPLISLILWAPGDYCNVNLPVRGIIRIFAKSVKNRLKSRVGPLRRLLSTLAQYIGTVESSKMPASNDVKIQFASVLCSEMKSQSLSSRQLFEQTFLLEPEWLSMLLSRNLMLSECPNLNDDLRSVSEAVKRLDLSPTALAQNSKRATKECGQKLTNNNVAFKMKKNQFGETPLHVACRKGNEARVEQLLNNMDCDMVHWQDHNGWTAMHEAIKESKIVSLLLKHHHQCAHLSLTVQGGEEALTPIQEALVRNHVETVRILLQYLSESGKLRELCHTQNLPHFCVTESTKKLLQSFLNATHLLHISDPLRFALLAQSYLYFYCAAFRLHAVKVVMKGYVSHHAQDHPLINVGYCYPFRKIFPGPLTASKFMLATIVRARDISTFWKEISKDQRSLARVMKKMK